MPALQKSVQPVQKGKIFWTAQMPCGCCYVQLVQFVQGNKTPTINAPAFRPSRPLSCRKRRLCQGQAHPGRFACLDIRRLASGPKNLRATDGNTSDWGSEQKYLGEKNTTKTCPYFAPTSSVFSSSFFPFSHRVLTRSLSPFLPTLPSGARLFSSPRLPGFAFRFGRIFIFIHPLFRFFLTTLSFCSGQFCVFLRPTYRFSSPPVILGRMGTVLHS